MGGGVFRIFTARAPVSLYRPIVYLTCRVSNRNLIPAYKPIFTLWNFHAMTVKCPLFFKMLCCCSIVVIMYAGWGHPLLCYFCCCCFSSLLVSFSKLCLRRGGQKSFGMFAYSPQNIGDIIAKKIRETIIFRKTLQDSHWRNVFKKKAILQTFFFVIFSVLPKNVQSWFCEMPSQIRALFFP